ncbi:MAG: NADP(H)-dependent aldo-keto reductase [Panacagrimonas sp.]
MQMRELGRTGVKLSHICLGTMTWGEQNTQSQAHEQMDYAVAEGVNCFDTAEMYPVPPKAETYGRTEELIGSWFQKTGKRNDVFLATKVLGPMATNYVRNGTRLDRQQILDACEASLKRLQTDVIDLYQVHWPQRPVNNFGRLAYEARQAQGPDIEETLGALDALVQQGKVRYIGVSNETAWGLHEYLRLSGEKNLARIVSIQNPYSLLNRSFEVNLSEFSHREDIGLLAYSPLAFGVLSGKYLDGAMPENSRLQLFKRFSRYTSPQGTAAARAYVELARAHDLDPAQMALAFVNSRPFVTANIIGATTMAQLRSNIGSAQIELSDALCKSIEEVHRQHTYPCP